MFTNSFAMVYLIYCIKFTICWHGYMINHLPYNPMDFSTMEKRPLQNIVGKGENAGYQHFLLFLQYFLPCREIQFVCPTVVRRCSEFGKV